MKTKPTEAEMFRAIRQAIITARDVQFMDKVIYGMDHERQNYMVELWLPIPVVKKDMPTMSVEEAFDRWASKLPIVHAPSPKEPAEAISLSPSVDVAELITQLRLIVAWHIPGGPTPAEKCPRKDLVCAKAADLLDHFYAPSFPPEPTHD